MYHFPLLVLFTDLGTFHRVYFLATVPDMPFMTYGAFVTHQFTYRVGLQVQEEACFLRLEFGVVSLFSNVGSIPFQVNAFDFIVLSIWNLVVHYHSKPSFLHHTYCANSCALSLEPSSSLTGILWAASYQSIKSKQVESLK